MAGKNWKAFFTYYSFDTLPFSVNSKYLRKVVIPYNEMLADRMRRTLANLSKVDEKKMFRGVTFMVVISIDFINNFNDRNKVLKEFKSVLKTG